MARTVEEWIGKTDDAMPPPRVRLRIFRKHDGRCHITGRKIMPGDKWECDHIKALIHGGENRESNMAPALVAPHDEKSAEEMAVKAKTDAVAKKHIGIRPRSKFANARGGRFKTTLTSNGPRTVLR